MAKRRKRTKQKQKERKKKKMNGSNKRCTIYEMVLWSGREAVEDENEVKYERQHRQQQQQQNRCRQGHKRKYPAPL